MPHPLHAALAGALAALSALALALGAGAVHVPPGTDLSAVARMADSLAPLWLALATLLALGAALAGLRRMGGALALASVLAAGHLAWAQVRTGQPLATDQPPDLTVLFLNAFADDGARADRILDAVLAEAADVVVIAEAAAITPALDRLRAAYPFVSDCDGCEIVVAARTAPLRFWRMALNPAWPPRYAVAELVLPGDRRLFVAASHLTKPWYTALADSERARLAAQWAWFDGPVVAVGDFNAAPWSRPVRDLVAATGLAPLRLPPGTWPAAARDRGLPIDLALTGNGARITSVRTFGAGTGSNHRGIVASIALP
ncbi:MAG: endonuclease/exonuclease/phosphatase family protein [Rhodobacteraceae bacterium]|nr:endonuclease/exonuclease/phosphatase family protein [Paracoccaceae bacterium]